MYTPTPQLKMAPGLVSRGAAHSTLGVSVSPTAVTRPLKPQESVSLPPGTPNALQHLLLHWELDSTTFSVSPLAHAQAFQQTHGHLYKCHGLEGPAT